MFIFPGFQSAYSKCLEGLGGLPPFLGVFRGNVLDHMGICNTNLIPLQSLVLFLCSQSHHQNARQRRGREPRTNSEIEELVPVLSRLSL